jgi:hypothetical protein
VDKLAFYDSMTSLSTVDLANAKVPGFNWYISNRWPNASGNWTTAPATSAADISASEFGLTLSSDRSGFGEGLNTATYDAGLGYVGQVWSPPFIFDATIKFNPEESLISDTSWPAFWSSAIQFLTGTLKGHDFIELDVFEAISSSSKNGVVSPSGTIHDWDSAGTSSNKYSGYRFIGWPTYTTPFRVSLLVISAAANDGVRGLALWFFNGVFVQGTDVAYGRGLKALPSATPANPSGSFADVDDQQFPLILGSFTNGATTFSNIRVYTS